MLRRVVSGVKAGTFSAYSSHHVQSQVVYVCRWDVG